MHRCGLAGNFLARLFSLDLRIAPLVPARVVTDTWRDTLEERTKYYTFRKQAEDDRWYDIHTNLHWGSPAIFKYGRYPIILKRIHPYQLLDDSLNVIEVQLADTAFSNFWIVDFYKNNMDCFNINSPIPPYSYSPVAYVDLDKFFDLDLWKEEYLRVCELVEITAHINEATLIHRSWYDLRVAPIIEKFKDSESSLNLDELQQERTLLDTVGRINDTDELIYATDFGRRITYTATWLEEYNALKGADWPDIAIDTELLSLPDSIIQEIMEMNPHSIMHKLVDLKFINLI